MSDTEEPPQRVKVPRGQLSDEETYEIILEANGLTREQLYKKPQLGERLEIFMVNFRQMTCLDRFPRLKHLEIIQQELTSIDGLQGCPLLEALFLPDNSIRAISGLDYCTNLRELQLNGNQIERIEGLQQLPALEVLMLCDNKVSSMDGIEHCRSLKRLWLAGNRISCVGTVLDSLQALEELNLAENLISSFAEIPNFARLGALKALYLSDPHFGENPVCALSNYRTYAVNQLGFLSILDAVRITEEAVTFAETTCSKKHMYYSMRIKTVKRHCSNVIRRSADARQHRLGLVQNKLNLLTKHLSDLDRAIEDRALASYASLTTASTSPHSKSARPGSAARPGTASRSQPPPPPPPLPLLQDKRSQITAAMQSRYKEIADIDAAHAAFSQTVTSVCAQLTARLQMERDSGGNIRLEDGRASSSDVWVSSCADLLQSRLQSNDPSMQELADLIASASQQYAKSLDKAARPPGSSAGPVSPLSSRTSKARLTVAPAAADPMSLWANPRWPLTGGSGALGAQALMAGIANNGGLVSARGINSAAASLGIRILRVTRVHNRFLRSRFEDQLESVFTQQAAAAMPKIEGREGGKIDFSQPPLTATAMMQLFEGMGGQYKRHLEYLFYALDPADPNQLLRAIEHGFSAVDANEALTDSSASSAPVAPLSSLLPLPTPEPLWAPTQRPRGDNCVMLTNSFAAAEMPRLAHLTRALQSTAASTGDVNSVGVVGGHPVTTGRMLIVKAYLGNQTALGATGPQPTVQSSASQPKLKRSKSQLAAEKAAADERASPVPAEATISSWAQSSHSPVRQADYPGVDSVYQQHAMDTKQKRWFVFDPRMILPEYLVEFEYVSPQHEVHTSLVQAQAECGVTEAAATLNQVISAPEFVGDVESALDSVAPAEFRMTPMTADSLGEVCGSLRPLLVQHLARQALAVQHSNRHDELNRILADMPPPMGPLNRLDRIDDDTVLLYGRALGSSADVPRTLHLSSANPIPAQLPFGPAGVDLFLSHIQYLNLHGQALKRIEGLRSLTSLHTLILSFNELTKIEGIAGMRTLRRVELGYNSISRVEGVHGLEEMEHIGLQNNMLYRLEDVNILLKCMPVLTSLSLRSNSIAEAKSYRLLVLSRLPRLLTFDGLPVDAAEHAAASTFVTAVSEEMVASRALIAIGQSASRASSNASSPRRAPFSLTQADLGSPAQLDSTQTPQLPHLSGKLMPAAKAQPALAAVGSRSTPTMITAPVNISDPNWHSQVVELDLSHQRLRKLQNLEKLVNLRRADFSNNELARISGLDTLINLEELSLEENRLSRVEGLTRLVHLKRLDLSKNRITRIEELDKLPHLEQLSLEGNSLRSLAGLATLQNLLELYVGNNQIGHLKELVHLRSLPKLIILDLSGNPMCREEDYRPYVMYHLRKLNVLDGTPFDAAEQAAARDKYDGRITYEFLIDRMGQPPKPFEQLVELDLSNSRLRSAEGLDGQRLTALRELNLEGNLLTHCRGLGSLKALQVLRLSNNRIVSTEMQSVSSQADGLSALGSTLQVLQMANNRITSIAGLHLGRMNELRVLYLQGNEITNIDGLDGCPMLRELVLDRNKIKKLDPRGFYGLQNLRELRLEENGLRTCAGMPQLPRLQLLYLSSNRLADLSEINYIAQQPVLLELILAGNPLSRKPMYRPSTVRRMMQLRFLDGKEVFDDERERAELLFANDGSSQPAGQYEFRTVTEQHEPHQPSPSVMQQHSMQQQQRGSFNGISAPTRDNRDTRDTRDSRINATSSASGMSITGSSPSPNLSSVAEPLQAGSFRPIALPAASATASYSTTSMVQSSSGRSRSMMQPQPPQHQFADESAHRGPSPHNQLHSLSSQAVTFDGGAGLGITGSGNSFGLDKRKPAPVTMASNLPPARGKVEAGTIGAGALASIAISGYGSNMGPSMASGLGSTVSSGRRATLPTNTMRPVSGQPPPLYNAISASQLLQVLGNNNNNSHTAAGSGRAAVAAVAAANAPRPPPMPPGAAARGGRRPAGINMFQA